MKVYPCTDCKTTDPSKFDKSSSEITGRLSICKDCAKKRRKLKTVGERRHSKIRKDLM